LQQEKLDDAHDFIHKHLEKLPTELRNKAYKVIFNLFGRQFESHSNPLNHVFETQVIVIGTAMVLW
jgi:hypothetical protein